MGHVPRLRDAPPVALTVMTLTARHPIEAKAATPTTRPSLLSVLARSKGAWALADQAVVSLGNFLTSILLIRHWHGAPQTYGQYALVFSVALFLNNVHGSLVTYPLTVRGAASGADGLRRMASSALAQSFCLAPILMLGLIAATMAVHRPSLLPFAAGAMLMWQAQETTRRALLAKLRHRDALPGDAMGYLVQAGVIWVMTHYATGVALTPETAFAAVGLTSLVGVVMQGYQLGVTPGGWVSLGHSIAESWRIGRWILFSTLVGAISTYAPGRGRRGGSRPLLGIGDHLEPDQPGDVHGFGPDRPGGSRRPRQRGWRGASRGGEVRAVRRGPAAALFLVPVARAAPGNGCVLRREFTVSGVDRVPARVRGRLRDDVRDHDLHGHSERAGTVPRNVRRCRRGLGGPHGLDGPSGYSLRAYWLDAGRNSTAYPAIARRGMDASPRPKGPGEPGGNAPAGSESVGRDFGL